MSKIHTALKESAHSAHSDSVSGKSVCSSLDEKLIAAGVAPDILTETRSVKVNNGGGFFNQLIRKKAISEISLLKILSEHFGLDFWPELPMESINIDFTQNISIQYLKKHKIVPLITPENPVIALNDPSNFQPVDDLRQILKNPDLPVVLSPQDAIMAAINMAYDMSRSSAKDYFEEMSQSSTDDLISKIDETTDLLDEASDAPIIKLVNLLLSGAIKDRASDIHVEPYSGNLKIRYRIDGILYDILSLPRRIQSPLISRIKIMAKLNIAEKRLPQDGRIEIKIADRLVDIREIGRASCRERV
jgi:general secretion pathway protein E